MFYLSIVLCQSSRPLDKLRGLEVFMDNLANFAERLIDLMKENELNAEKLGKASGVASQQIRRYAHGKDIYVSTLLRLADYFKCSIDYISGRSNIYLDFAPTNCPNFMEWLPTVLNECGKTTYRIFEDTRIKSSYFADWRKGTEPLLSSLIVLADYLDCSLDRLVGRDR